MEKKLLKHHPIPKHVLHFIIHEVLRTETKKHMHKWDTHQMKKCDFLLKLIVSH